MKEATAVNQLKAILRHMRARNMPESLEMTNAIADLQDELADLQQQLNEANRRGELLERQVSVCFHAGESLYKFGSNLGEFLRRLPELESKLFADPILSPTATSQKDKRCESCNGTGDLTRFDGEWIGYCPLCATATSKRGAE